MRRAAIVLLAVVFLAGCATVPRKPAAPGGEVPAMELCRQYNMDCQWDGVARTLTMNYGQRRLQGMVGSNIIMAGKDRIALSAPLVMRRGVVFLPPDFERAVLGPAPERQDDALKGAMSGRLQKVVVDAGHGGKDTGAIGINGMKEKDINLDIARRVQKSFERAGIKVIMTRDSDEFITLQDRTVIASQPGVDLFVSLHANANKSRRAHGIEVYYVGPLSAEDKFEGQRQINEKKLAALLNMKQDVPDLKDVVSDMLYACKLALSPGVSDAVTRGLSREQVAANRGSKPERFYVLRNTLVPAILVETGFVTNPREAADLKDPAYRDKLADIITRSILRYMYASGL